MIRSGDFRLHRQVHKEIQVFPRARTLIVAHCEDPDPRFDDLFLYNDDFQYCHVDLRGYGEGEPEELPPSVSFCAHPVATER